MISYLLKDQFPTGFPFLDLSNTSILKMADIDPLHKAVATHVAISTWGYRGVALYVPQRIES